MLQIYNVMSQSACFAAGYVALFTLPKVYEQNKEKIDEVFGQVKEKVGEISAK